MEKNVKYYSIADIAQMIRPKLKIGELYAIRYQYEDFTIVNVYKVLRIIGDEVIVTLLMGTADRFNRYIPSASDDYVSVEDYTCRRETIKGFLKDKVKVET